MTNVLFSHKSDDWATPSSIYQTFVKNNWFDPCPFQATKKNGLDIPWEKRTYCNPPYSELGFWVAKAVREFEKGNEVVLLIPARTDTAYFRYLWRAGASFFFITGRLRFNDKGNAPFPSVFVHLKQSGIRIVDFMDAEVVPLWVNSL